MDAMIDSSAAGIYSQYAQAGAANHMHSAAGDRGHVDLQDVSDNERLVQHPTAALRVGLKVTRPKQVDLDGPLFPVAQMAVSKNWNE